VNLCAGIISEITSVDNLLPACNFKHVNREANQDAHQLAQRGIPGMRGYICANLQAVKCDASPQLAVPDNSS
jgi:hypothetical protein